MSIWGGRVGLPTPPTPIIALFLAFLSRDDEVAPPGLLPHTATPPLLEVADFLGVDTDNQFRLERWIGERTGRLAMEARIQLARRASCLFFVKKLIGAWFEYLSNYTQICFVVKRAVPHNHSKNELNHIVDGDPFMHVLDAPYAHTPVVVGGRLPPSSGFTSGQASEEGAGTLQRKWMNDLYQLCADDVGRDLLVRNISNHGLYVRALPLVAMTTNRELANIQEFGTAAFLVSIAPWPNYHVQGDRNGDGNGGRRANEPMPRHADQQGHSRSRSRGRKRHRSTWGENDTRTARAARASLACRSARLACVALARALAGPFLVMCACSLLLLSCGMMVAQRPRKCSNPPRVAL